MDGLTGLKTVAIRFRRPKALRTPCVFFGSPIEERIRVILKKGMFSDVLGPHEIGLVKFRFANVSGASRLIGHLHDLSEPL